MGPSSCGASRAGSAWPRWWGAPVLCGGVALSSDGRWLASAGLDGTVRVWEVGNGQLQTTLSAHKDGVQSVAFSGDGYLLGSGGSDATVKLWDTTSGAALCILQPDRIYERLNISALTGVTQPAAGFDDRPRRGKPRGERRREEPKLDGCRAQLSGWHEVPARHLSRILATAPSSGLARRGPTACAALLVRDSVEKPSAAAARATLPSFAARRLSKCQSARSRAQRAHPVVRPLAEARSRSAASEGRQRGLRRPGRGTACAAPPTQRGAERHPPADPRPPITGLCAVRRAEAPW